MIRSVVASAAGVLLAASYGSCAQAETPRVGVTSAVNPSAAGTPPGAASRQLFIGADVVFRERVITTSDGQAQLLFLDQSSLLIGPNSSVVIDEFVYDPSTQKGNIAATLTQGSFRYIGGKLSKQGNATLRTPVATIGIRGSDVTVTFDSAKNQADVITTHGSANVQTQGGSLGLRTGFGATIGSLNQPPGQAFALSAAQIAAVNKIFEGQPGKIAGAQELPTNERVANSQLGSAIEAQRLAAIETAAGGSTNSNSPNLPVIEPPRPEDNGASSTVPPPPPPTSGNGSNGGTGGAGGNGNNGNNNGGNTGGGNNGGSNPPVETTRTARIMNGYVSGLARVRNDDDYSRHRVTNDRPTDVMIRTIPDADGNGRVLATFHFRGEDAESFAADIEMGDRPGSKPARRSVFLDDSSFAATQEARARREKGHINGTKARAEGAMVSIGGIGPNASQEAGNVLCECRFVEWGVWEAKLGTRWSDESVRVRNGLWVAGVLPDLNDPSPTGSATFNGTAVGFVRNQGQTYGAAGDFKNVYNFGQRRGDVTISNFDGKTFTGEVRPTSANDWRSYQGALSSPGVNGSIDGAFYGHRNTGGASTNNQPRETAGNFNVGGNRYSASGIFAGKQ